MIKPINRLGIKGRYLNTIKAIQGKPVANIIPNGENLIAFFYDQQQDQDSPSPLVSNKVFELSDKAISQHKETKGILTGKEKVKMSL